MKLAQQNGLLVWGRLAIMVLMIGMSYVLSAQTIRNPQTVCPYDTTRPPCSVTGLTACPAGYQFKHQQDCCGAVRLCKDTNTVYGQYGGNPASRINANVCGEGCKAAEISDVNSCLTSSENQTSWYIFEVRPLPDGGRNVGDFAGYLRMKILPCDLPPNSATCGTPANPCDCDRVTATRPNVFNDNGNGSIGDTDYDWILYEVTHFPRGADLTAACPLMPRVPDITGNRPRTRPWIRACNFSGDRGPTGLYDPGRTPGGGDSSVNASGNRYLTPIKVYVGQRFILAVDNFSTNINGYKIDFTGRGNRFVFPPRFGVPDPWPSATVVPPSGAIKLDTTIDVSTCAENVIRIRFNRAIPYDSVRLGRFSIRNPNVPPVNILSIKPDPADTVLGFARRFILTTTQLFSSTTYRLIQNFPIADPCGNQDQLDTTDFIVKPFTYFDTIKTVCQNPFAIPRYGNSLKTVTVRSKISKSVQFDNANYRYEWKVFAGLSGTDSVFVTIPTTTGNDSMRVLPPVLTNNINTRLGPALVYTPTSSNATYRVPIRLKSFISTGVCVDSARGMITVNAVPSFGPDSINVCFGDPIRYAVAPNDTIGRKFTWRSAIRRNWAPTGGTLSYTSDTLAYDVVNAQVDDRRTGCTYFTKPFNVQTAQRFFPAFSIDTVSLTANTYPMKVRLNNLTKRQSVDNRLIPIQTRGLSFRWDMGNGDRVVTAGRDTAYYTYLSQGTQREGTQYSINLEVYDTLAYKVTPNCVVSRVEQPIVVFNPLLPNVITPGIADGANDNLFVTGISKDANLRLYNRYGVLLYNVEGYKNDFTASNYAAGTYYYILDDKLTGKRLTGWLEVMR